MEVGAVVESCEVGVALLGGSRVGSRRGVPERVRGPPLPPERDICRAPAGALQISVHTLSAVLSLPSATASEGAVEVDGRVERRFWREDFGTDLSVSRGVCEHLQ